MKKFFTLLLFTLLISTFPSFSKAQSIDSVRVSLLTCSPGTEIYSLFGHTAIRYENQAKDMDIVFNYGIFSFNTPNFIWRFVKGETDYQLGVTPFVYFESEYYMRGSAVFEQELNLLPEEKQKLWEILETNYRIENRVYRYNYFFDNCTTRARDKIEESLNGELVYQEDNRTLSFRDIVHQYTEGHEWAEFGIDLCLGSKADEIADYRQKMFAPFYLMAAIDSAKVVNGDIERKLVVDTKEIVPAEVEQDVTNFWLTPLQASCLLFLFVLILSIYGVWKKKMLWWLDILLFGTAGLAGCVIAFLVFFSVHPTVTPNYLLILFHPIHLIYLPFMVYRAVKKKKDAYHLINFIVLTLFIALWGIIPQSFNLAVLPLALCLLTRSVSQLILYRKIK